MVNGLVKPEYQFVGENPPLHPLRMSWPFKTEEECEVIRRWSKQQRREVNKLTNMEEAPF